MAKRSEAQKRANLAATLRSVEELRRAVAKLRATQPPQELPQP
jgi:hypothetical protein